MRRPFARWGAAVLACGVLYVVAPAVALAAQSQAAPGVSRPVIQQVPNSATMALNEALTRLGTNPRDVSALVDAGHAALAIGDVDAAIGFFRRADQVSPGNPRVKAGLASALVRSEDPFDAIGLFDEIERAGVMDPALLADRGLAYDLVGDNASAQHYYSQALARGSGDEVIHRLSLSYAMAGDRKAAGNTIAPLLQRQDKAAWRTRAFSLAILGQVDEAVSIAKSSLPADLAEGIAPYLRYMPRLTRAQQAAAANFGHFPRASEIGRDDPSVARYWTARPGQASAGALAAAGEPQGRDGRARGSRVAVTSPRPDAERLARSVRVTPPVPPSTSPLRTLPPEPQPGRIADSRPMTAAPPVSPPQVPPSPPLAAAPAAGPVPLAAAPAPQPSQAPAPAPQAASPGPAIQPPTRPRSLAEVFSDFAKPALDASPASGAVDVRRINPPRQPAGASESATASAENGKTAAGKVAAGKGRSAKPPPPSHPSRIWVQLAAGRDKSALAWDWRRLSREAAAALRGKHPFVSAWGRTNRLLAGPFPTEAAATSFMSQLRRAGVEDTFTWTSPAGQVVDALPVP